MAFAFAFDSELGAPEDELAARRGRRAWPATICLTSASDPNSCGSNTVRIDGPGKKVVATSCNHLRLANEQ